MLKYLAILAVALAVFHCQTYAQSNKAQQTYQSDKPAPPTPNIPTQQRNSKSLQPEYKQYVDADVRVISTPAKDRYDQASFWAGIILALVGIGGIAVAVITLIRIHRQAVEMRLQRIIMQRTLGAIKIQAIHMKAQTELVKQKERARLSVIPMEVTSLPREFLLWEEFDVKIENHGITMALNVIVTGRGILVVEGEEPTFHDLVISSPDIIRAGESQVVRVSYYAAGNSTWEGLEAGKIKYVTLQMKGRIEYGDIFGNHYITAFRYAKDALALSELKPDAERRPIMGPNWAKSGTREENQAT